MICAFEKHTDACQVRLGTKIQSKIDIINFVNRAIQVVHFFLKLIRIDMKFLEQFHLAMDVLGLSPEFTPK